MTKPAKDGTAGRENPAGSGSTEANALREEIGRGGSDDKVATVDPAAGAPPTREEAEAAQQRETWRAAGDGSRPVPVIATDSRSTQWKGDFVLAAAVLVIAGLLVWLFSIS